MSKKQGLQKVEPMPPAMSRDDVMQMLGAARYAEWLADQSASHVMQFLMTVEDQKLYLAAGDKTFVEFLERSGMKKKSSYYNHRGLLLKEGPELFDLMEEWGVPARVRQQILAGDIRLDGKDVFIGDEKLDPGSPTIAKQVIEKLVRDKIAADKELAKLTGYKEKYDTLSAAISDAADEPEYVTAFKQALQGLRVLITEVKDLPGEMKGERGPLDLPEIYLLIEQLVDEYGEPMPWIRGSWNSERPNGREREKLPYFKSDAIDGDNF